MNFKYIEQDELKDYLSLKTDTHHEIRIVFDGNEFQYITFDGYEFEGDNEAMDGLYVIVNGEFKTLRQIANACESKLDDLRSEYEEEAREESDMRNELSSPYFTGRI